MKRPSPWLIGALTATLAVWFGSWFLRNYERVAVEVPAAPVARRSLYLKVRDRESYEFALASVAAALRVENGMIAEARVALGGVATKPWRARRAERLLVGAPAEPETFVRAAHEEAGGVPPGSDLYTWLMWAEERADALAPLSVLRLPGDLPGLHPGD